MKHTPEQSGQDLTGGRNGKMGNSSGQNQTGYMSDIDIKTTKEARRHTKKKKKEVCKIAERKTKKQVLPSQHCSYALVTPPFTKVRQK